MPRRRREDPEDPLLGALKAMGDPVRLRILRVLLDGPRSVRDLVAEVDVSQPDVSHHLKKLRVAGLILGLRDGRKTLYAIVEEGGREQRALLSALRTLGWRGAAPAGKPPPAPGPARVPGPVRAASADRRKRDLEDFLL